MIKSEEEWKAIRAEIVSRLDVQSELESAGLKIKSGAVPSPKGWLACHSAYREDKSASAGVNVGSGPMRGVYKDFSGSTAKARSFFQLFVDLGGGYDFGDAFRILAKKTGVQYGSTKELSHEDAKTYAGNLDEKKIKELMETRGFTRETITKFSIGWHPKRKMWTIPVYDKNGGLHNIKLHKGGGKRPSWLKTGKGAPLFGANKLATAPKGSTIVITEGEFDAILCKQATGFTSVSATAGCLGFSERFLSAFEGQRIVLVYDCDAEGRTGAHRTAELFRDYVERGVVSSVNVLWLYDKQDKGHKDITDWLVKDGGEGDSLSLLIDIAAPWTYESRTIESNSVLVTNIAIADPEKKITIVPGDEEKVIANFILIIKNDIHVVYQSGDENRKFFCGVESANWNKTFEICAQDFTDDKKLKAAISVAAGSLAVLDGRCIDMIRVAGAKASNDIKRVNRVEAFGVIHGAVTPTYISPSVSIIDGKVLRTSETGREVRYDDSELHQKAARLLDLKYDDHDAVQVLLGKALEGIVQLYGITLGGALLANVTLAIAQDLDGIQHVFDSRVATWVTGPSGSGKTDMALTAMRFFGQFSKTDLPSWADTANAVEREMTACNSAVIVADDFKADLLTGNSAEQARRVLQSYSSGRARNRLSASGGFINTPPIRSQLIVTGEDEPQGQTSIKARGVWLDARKIKKDVELYQVVRGLSWHFSSITPYLIAWLQKQGADALQDAFRSSGNRFEQAILQVECTDDNTHRLAANMSLLNGGFELFMGFVKSFSAMEWEDERCDALSRTFFNEMIRSIPDHLESIALERPAEVFLSAIQSMVATGAAKIIDATRVSNVIRSNTQPAPHDKIIGYCVDEEVDYEFPENSGRTIYIVPEIAIASVNDHLRRVRGDRINFSAKAIGQGLEDTGNLSLVKAGNRFRRTSRMSINKMRVNVWALQGSMVDCLVTEDQN